MKLFLTSLLFIFSMQTFAQLQPITSGVYHWNDLAVTKDKQREGRKILEGTTAEFAWFEIHATTQEKGAVPKPPHTQKDVEEVIIIKEGTLKCTIGDKTAELGAGSVLLIPPGEMQTFENIGNGPVTYYVLMFRSRKPLDVERSENAGGALLINKDTIAYTEKNDRGTEKYFDRPTATCERYEMHVTTLKKKGPSHAPHQHVETEIFLVISGEAEVTVDGQLYKSNAGDLIIAESGKMHGIANATDGTCSYFAFKWR